VAVDTQQQTAAEALQQRAHEVGLAAADAQTPAPPAAPAPAPGPPQGGSGGGPA
jgi:hypothetical protein